ncbi:MAG: CHAD domain-containing protein [Alphaproteobacteria bacterium]
MAYRIDPSLQLDEEVRRIAVEQIGKAQDALADDPVTPDEISLARRRLKKLRGLLRLMRPAMGEEYFRKENWRWRDCARLLSIRRDANAAIEAFSLVAQHPYELYTKNEVPQLVTAGRVPGDPFLSELRVKLAARRDRLDLIHAGIPEAVDRVLAELDAGKVQLAALPLATFHPQQAVAAIGRVYGQAAAGYRRAVERPDIAVFHDWRKWAKYHWMHLQLIRNVWPSPLKMRANACKRLADILGDANDLAVLEALLASDPSLGVGTDDFLALRSRIGAIRIDLFNQALVHGEALFSRNASWFTDRIALVWDSDFNGSMAASTKSAPALQR